MDGLKEDDVVIDSEGELTEGSRIKVVSTLTRAAKWLAS